MTVFWSRTQNEIRARFGIVATALHLTKIENLEGIFREGAILSKTRMAGRRFQDISDPGIQETRATKTVPCSGRVLHDYVPLFVSYKAPMVAKLQGENQRLVYIAFSQCIFSRYPGTIITDGNAAAASTVFREFNSIEDLEILDFNIIQKTVGYARDDEKARRKAAEILVPDRLLIEEIRFLTFFDEASRAEGLDISQSCGKNFATLVNKGWFFTTPTTMPPEGST